MKSKRVRGAEEVWDIGGASINRGGLSGSKGGVGVRRAIRHGVADRLHSAAIHLLRRVRSVDSESGISPARLSALSVLVFGGPRSLRKLADTEQVTPPTMSKIVQGLEADGLVVRKEDRHDKRAIQLRATSKGKSRLQQARKLRINLIDQLLTKSSKNELAVLQQAAQIIEQAVNR